MNKRVIFSWLSIVPPMLVIIFILVQNYISIIVLRTIFFIIMLVLFIIWPFYLLLILPFVCTPKTKLPEKINVLTFKKDIKCTQKDFNVYTVSLYNKELEIDMSGWIFKRKYIRDIILMYYHLNYYNLHKLKSHKCLSKHYFKNETILMEFILRNGKTKKSYLIKNGKEKRSFICTLKILFLAGSLDRRTKYKKDKYYSNTVTNLYI